MIQQLINDNKRLQKQLRNVSTQLRRTQNQPQAVSQYKSTTSGRMSVAARLLRESIDVRKHGRKRLKPDPKISVINLITDSNWVHTKLENKIWVISYNFFSRLQVSKEINGSRAHSVGIFDIGDGLKSTNGNNGDKKDNSNNNNKEDNNEKNNSNSNNIRNNSNSRHSTQTGGDHGGGIDDINGNHRLAPRQIVLKNRDRSQSRFKSKSNSKSSYSTNSRERSFTDNSSSKRKEREKNESPQRMESSIIDNNVDAGSRTNRHGATDSSLRIDIDHDISSRERNSVPHTLHVLSPQSINNSHSGLQAIVSANDSLSSDNERVSHLIALQRGSKSVRAPSGDEQMFDGTSIYDIQSVFSTRGRRTSDAKKTLKLDNICVTDSFVAISKPHE